MGCGASSSKDNGFQHGEPDFEYDEIVECFREGNGLLFRLENKRTQEWAYFNDTKDFEMHVKIIFRRGSELTALGNTNLEEDARGELMAYTVVFPGQTELFVQGHVEGFKSRIDALPLGDDYKAHMKANKKKKR
ncbi:calpain-like cysteine peptidase, Clan CA, family C2 [Angomonas deanei]|uniref:DUF1935 domain-containing protein n=1 Tax=Angomonas deanei TaxID=59799 RepID=A0A7G2C8M5_9TRYP|nr:calpain-like cysteine peptidase, Clan CA, family C2 [Angomonas deanei]CAD2215177.1 Domain of unknown function (DUF1935), putative [Angomonas deanei]|eukprot:EPY33088.1 calpain-like cysteine peptidase, Clan CA, family C2 [Angomonas deanei]